MGRNPNFDYPPGGRDAENSIRFQDGFGVSKLYFIGCRDELHDEIDNPGLRYCDSFRSDGPRAIMAPIYEKMKVKLGNKLDDIPTEWINASLRANSRCQEVET